MLEILNFIDGKFTASSQFLDVVNPAKNQIYARVALASSQDVDQAVQSAQKAFPAWAALSFSERAVFLKKLSAKIEENFQLMCELESIDTGKPIRVCQNVDIPRSIKNLDFFSDYWKEFKGASFDNPDSSNSIQYEPLGVVGCISPWNLPLYLFTWKIAPALICGNTVVAKPSEITPRTAYEFAKYCKEILPPGVLNIVQGDYKTGQSIVQHPDVKAISFTGSTMAGRWIAEQASKNFKKLCLEMGGKNPCIVFADADLEKAIPTIVRSSFSNQGQICLCSSRILVDAKIYDEFVHLLVKETLKLHPANPQNQNSNFGSLVSKAHFDKVMNFIQLGIKEGGKILCGGKKANVENFEEGFFIEPTLIEALPSNSVCNTEEIFGPVVTMQKFDSEENAADCANLTDYGLSACIWTTDKEKARRVAKKIKAGVVWVNTWMERDLRTPFGGMKNSGYGSREGGLEIMKFFSETKNICESKV